MMIATMIVPKLITSGDAKVVTIAISMPTMPKALPWRAVTGDDRPRSAMMNSTEASR